MADRPQEDHIHTWFGLTYSNYLVLPRSVLQSAPDGWQERFVGLLGELNDMFGHLDWPRTYRVSAISDDGRFVRDPIPHYERGRAYVPPRLPGVVTVTWPEPEPLLDPDCRDGKCGSCVGDPCEHGCHTGETSEAAGGGS